MFRFGAGYANLILLDVALETLNEPWGGLVSKASRLLLVGSFFLAACSETKFQSDKASTLSKVAVLGDLGQPGAIGNGISDGTASGVITQPAAGGGSGNAGGVITQPGSEGGATRGVIHQPDGTDDEIDFVLMCSDRRSEDAANFKGAVASNLPVQLAIDSSVCSSDVGVIKGLIEKKKFTLADARSICPTLVPASGTWANVSLVVDGKPYNAMKGSITVLYALNKQTSPAEQAADELCDKRSSPLVIHLASDVARPRAVELSSQKRGVDFDLLGDKAARTPVRISWFTNSDYGLLALPDAAGRVSSIDQLFGNATVGPDGLFADDGYAALAKYDANADGRIDQLDPVFARLRVWVDSRRDGIASPNELRSLFEVGVTFIDLAYSTDFAETDKYGNQTLMKSVVGRADGSLDLIFDVWFAYQFKGF